MPQEGRSERRLSQETARRTKGKEAPQDKKQKAQQRKETEKKNQNKKNKRKTNATQEKQKERNTTQHMVVQVKPLFCTAKGSSDAELRVGLKLSGVPPWETQLGSTNELTGSNLVEHERLGTHP